MPVPVVTLVLIAANVIVWGITLALGADVIQPTPQKMIDLGGNLAPLTLGDEPWRLLSSMFLHYGVLHIAMNMIGLYSGGRLAESMYGRASFASLYVIAGLAGGLASASWKANTVSAGASGAIFGVFGAVGAFLLAHRQRFDSQVVQKEARGLLVFLFYNLIYGVSKKSVDMSAHLGGLAAGFVVGLGFELGRTLGQRAMTRVAAVTVAGLALCGVALATLPVPAGLPHPAAYAELDRLEKSTLPVFGQLLEDVDAGKVAKDVAAGRVEKELLPPWTAMQQRLWSLPEAPARLKELHRAVIAYVDARLAHFRAILDFLHGRETDETALQQRGADLEQALKRIEEVSARMNAE